MSGFRRRVKWLAVRCEHNALQIDLSIAAMSLQRGNATTNEFNCPPTDSSVCRHGVEVDQQQDDASMVEVECSLDLAGGQHDEHSHAMERLIRLSPDAVFREVLLFV